MIFLNMFVLNEKYKQVVSSDKEQEFGPSHIYYICHENGLAKALFKIIFIWWHTRTYIHNWSLQPFSQDYDQTSHTTYVCCVCSL